MRLDLCPQLAIGTHCTSLLLVHSPEHLETCWSAFLGVLSLLESIPSIASQGILCGSEVPSISEWREDALNKIAHPWPPTPPLTSSQCSRPCTPHPTLSLAHQHPHPTLGWGGSMGGGVQAGGRCCGARAGAERCLRWLSCAAPGPPRRVITPRRVDLPSLAVGSLVSRSQTALVALLFPGSARAGRPV